MSKLQTALTSLVAVIPAGLLMYVLVMGMMSNLDGVTGSIGLMIGVGLVVICCLGVLATPILAFVTSSGGEVEPELGGDVDAFDGDDEFGSSDDLGGEADEFEDFDEGAETLVADGGEEDFEDEEWGDDEEWDDEEDEWA